MHAASSPLSTYRLQLTPSFGFEQLGRLAPYLKKLGVSHVYLSPCLQAKSGSMHGYDVTDPTLVRTEFGGEEAARRAFSLCRDQGLAIVVDWVPNHMAADPVENPWWRDVLKFGAHSRFAPFFDIDWSRHNRRLLLPILGTRYAECIQNGTIALVLTEGSLALRVYDRPLPVTPTSLPLIWKELAPEYPAIAERLHPLEQRSTRETPDALESAEAALWVELTRAPLQEPTERLLAAYNKSPERLDALLEQQHYQLSYWRSGLNEINYRRFFDISELAALRVEDEHVFTVTHSRLSDWVKDDLVAGVRVDHPDGLKEPARYFDRLRALVGERWVLAEKILEPGERLPREWRVEGTTGYDFLNAVARLFVDPQGEERLTSHYCWLSRLKSYDFSRLVYTKKKEILPRLFGAEVETLTTRALRILHGTWNGRDFSREETRRALIELIARFPVYRTYLRSGEPVREIDRTYLERARTNAQKKEPALAPIIGEIVRWLLAVDASDEWDSFASKFQQLSGPAMAKGLEDTAFYCDARLLALNEVGGNPGQFGSSVEQFHRFCSEMQESYPRSLLATSTHDTKRSEDTRIRISLLSEIAEEWTAISEGWNQHAQRFSKYRKVDPTMLYFLFQTLVGTWPITLERLLPYMIKAGREAKSWTSWRKPDYARESALKALIGDLYQDQTFLHQLTEFCERLKPYAQRHSLSQLLLKLTAPGVPDIYQGTELWDHSLADPDNRRPVDYQARERWLDELQSAEDPLQFIEHQPDAAKLWTLHATLALRQLHPHCFGPDAAYTPLNVEGEQAQRVVAYLRGDRVAVIVPRLTLGLSRGWENTEVKLPPGSFVNVFTKDRVEQSSVAELLRRFPIALLVAERTGHES